MFPGKERHNRWNGKTNLVAGLRRLGLRGSSLLGGGGGGGCGSHCDGWAVVVAVDASCK